MALSSNDAAVRADAERINQICHCFGDLAMRRFLDAVELAKETNPEWDRRAVTSHAQLVHPEDRPRFAELNATYDTTGQWMGLDPYASTITPERLGQTFWIMLSSSQRAMRIANDHGIQSERPVDAVGCSRAQR